MGIHSCIIFRHLLKEVNKIRNIREYLDPGLHHSGNFLQINIPGNGPLDIRQSHFIKLVKVHGFHIFPVHPAKFLNVKYCRRFAHVMIVKHFHQFFQRKDLPVVLRAPAQESHIVYNGLCQESLLYQIFIRRMAGTFAQFFVLFVGDQRAMYIGRHFPAESLVNTVVFWRRRQILISSYHMSDPHKVIIYYISEVIGRIAVRLDQDQIVQLVVWHGNVSVNIVVESGGSLCRHVKTDYMGFSCSQFCLYLLFAQMKAVLIVHSYFLTLDIGL